MTAKTDLPFLLLGNVDPDVVIEPVSRGYSIRDPRGALSVVVTASPSDACLTGVYEGSVTIESPNLAEPVIVPVTVSVGAELIGTAVFEVRNQDNTLLPGAAVTLIGLDEQLDPVRFDVTADEEGLATFENIPAGVYTLRVTAEDHGELETTVEIAALIDRTPRVVTLNRRLFTFMLDELATAELHTSSVATANYDSAVYQAQLLQNSGEPQLEPNFPADEKEFFYQSGKLLNKVSFRNPDGAEAAVESITFRVIEPDAAIPDGAVTFGGSGTLSPIKSLESLQPGEVFDLVWNLDVERFFRPASIRETETPGQYAIAFPADVTREQIDAYLAANDPAGVGFLRELSFDAASNTGVFEARSNGDGTYFTPSDRVPLFYGARPYWFDFVILGSGVRADTQEVVETRLPVRVHYVAPDYYVSAGEPDSLYDENGNYTGQQSGSIYDIHPDIEQKILTAPTFDAASGRLSEMRYSTGFLNHLQAGQPERPMAQASSPVSFGFAGDIGYEGQVTTLRMKLKNPSRQHPMEDVRLRLVLSDAPGGSGSIMTPNLNVYIKGGHLEAHGDLVEGYIDPGDEATVEFSFRLDQIIPDYEHLTEFDETLRPYLRWPFDLTLLYAFLDVSFLLDGERTDFTTEEREYQVKEQPKLFASYDLEDIGGEHYVLRATVTNLGRGDANKVYLGAPALPNTGFDMKVVNVASTRGAVSRGQSAQLDRVEIPVLRAGDTAIVTYELAILGQLSSAQKLSLGKLAALPSLPIKSEISEGIVRAPMKLEAMRGESAVANIYEIIDELALLDANIKQLSDKTATELGRSLANYYDYTVSLQRAVSVGDAYAAIAKLVNLMSTLKDLAGKPGDLKKTSSTVQKRIKQFSDNAAKGQGLAYLQRWYDLAYKGLQKNLTDKKWIFENMPKDMKYWEDSYQELQGALQASELKGSMNQKFKDYVNATQSAAAALSEAATAINLAMNTGSAAELAEQTKRARARMEEAAYLLDQASALKAEGDSLFEKASSGITGTENKALDIAADQLRVQAKYYVAQAERILSPQVTNIAVSLAQLAGLAKLEENVNALQSSSRQIQTLLGSDELVAEDAQGLVDAANNIFKNIGYDPNASAKDKIKALRGGREALNKSLSDMAMRPVVWIKDMFTVTDSTHLVEVKESVPDMVRAAGHVMGMLERNEISRTDKARIASEILKELFGSDAEAYSWFKADFAANFPDGNPSKTELYSYIATEMVKVSSRQLYNVELVEKSIETQLLAGYSDYRAMIEAAQASGTGKKTNIYRMQDDSQAQIEQTIDLLNRYKTDMTLLTSYYPSEQLLAYVKGLNTQITAMTHYADGTPIPASRVGRYRSLWTYSGNGLDLQVDEITLGEIYQAQMLVDELLAEGYNNVAERWELNDRKKWESVVSVGGTLLGMATSGALSSGIGAAASMAGAIMDTSGYTTAMNTLDNANLYNLARATADLTVTTNLMLSKELAVAYDVRSVFETMDGWRKVDPELPLELVTADVADLTVADNIIASEATAALTVLNNHTGSVTVAPTVEIYDSFGLVSVESMGAQTIAPGETGEFVVGVPVPVNMLRDMGGYTAVFTFAASEAETMTIAPSFGPYITHFNVGTAETVDYLRAHAAATQPLGGTLAAGESKSASVTVEDGTLLYVFAAAPSDEKLTLTVEGGGNRQVKSHINDGDFVLIPDASGRYVITVANGGETALTYDLSVVASPDLGAVAGLDMPYVRAIASEYSVELDGENVTGVKASLPLSVYETGLTTGMEISVETSALSDGDGHSIPAPELTDRRGETVSGAVSLSAGGGCSLVLGYYPAAGTPDGAYTGAVTLRVAAERFETELSPLGWVRTGDGYELTVPVTVQLDTSVPADASLEAEIEGSGRIAVTGTSMPGASVVVFLAEDESAAGEAFGPISAGADGAFRATLDPLGDGVWYVYARTAGENGTLGAASERVAVETFVSDTTAPTIALLSPQTDVQLGVDVAELIFTVSDAESALTGTPTLTVNNAAAAVTQLSPGRFRAVPATGSLGDGTHSVKIAAESEGGRAVERFTVIIGSQLTASVSVTADGKPVSGATVVLDGSGATTGADGTATFTVAPGAYPYTVEKDGFLTESGTAELSAASRDVNVTLSAGSELEVNVSGGGIQVAGATVTIGAYQATTGADGAARLTIPYGSYRWSAAAEGFRNGSGDLAFTADASKTLQVTLAVNTSGQYQALLRVADALDQPIVGAAVTLDGETVTTDENGEALFWKNVGSYDAEIAAEGCAAYSGKLAVDATNTEQPFTMQPAGASYNTATEMLTVSKGYTAWTEKTGGERVTSGTVEREREDRVLYIDRGVGERVPLVIPALDELRIRAAETTSGTDGAVSVRLGNYTAEATGAAQLLGALYDADGRLLAVTAAEASLAPGEERTPTLRFGRSVAGCTVRVFLIEKESGKPLCAAKTVQ